MVAAPLLDSSSGCACTAMRRSRSAGGSVTGSPRRKRRAAARRLSLTERGTRLMTSGRVPDHADPPPRPADRYGRRGPGGTQWSTGRRRSAGSARPDRHRWRTYAGLALFAVALLTAVIVVYLRSATGVHVIERGFVIQSPTAVQIEFEVVKAPGADAVCAVRSPRKPRDRTAHTASAPMGTAARSCAMCWPRRRW